MPTDLYDCYAQIMGYLGGITPNDLGWVESGRGVGERSGRCAAGVADPCSRSHINSWKETRKVSGTR